MRSEEGLLLLNERGRILWSNAFAADLLGFTRAELCQLALPLVGPAPDPAQSATTQRIRLTPPLLRADELEAPSIGPVAGAFRAILAGKVVEAEGEARVPDKNEKRVAVHWRLWALPGSPDKRRILLSLSETAQASAEGPVTSGYRDVFEHAVEGIYRSTFQGQLLEVNPALARMCGYDSPAEMIDCVRDLNTEYYQRSSRRAEFIRDIRQSGSIAGFESETFRSDGSVFWTAEFARVVSDLEGNPLYLEGSVIDVSKRKQVESALRLSEEKFRSLVETTRVVPFEFHLSTRYFVYIGPQAEAVLQCSIGTRMTWDRWMALLHPEDCPAGTRFAERPLLQPPADYQTEFRIVGEAGEVIWIRQIVHYEWREGIDDAVVRGFFFDISEAKKLEVERENSRTELRELALRLQQVREEERTKIAREIHDEIGQSLTLLKMDLSWMDQRLTVAVPPELHEPLSGRISRMVEKVENAFQSVRRIILGLRPPLLDEVGLKDAIEFHLAAFAKSAGIRCELEASSVSILDVTAQLAVFRIFQEMLTNVARHARATRVKVRLREAEDFFFMSVEDNGCGIPEGRGKELKNFGILGMQERALAMGGRVELSALNGKGTLVALKIPVSRGEAFAEALGSAEKVAAE